MIGAIASWIAANPQATAFLAQAGYGLGKATGLWGKPPKRKRSRFETGYVSELQRRSKEGVFTPGMQKEILSGTTSRLAEVAGRRREAIRGNIASQGLEDSIVSTYATRPIDRDVIANVAQVARELATRNQLSKVGAQDQLGQYGMDRTRQRYEELLSGYQARQQGWGSTFQGLAESFPKDMDKGQLADILGQAKDPRQMLDLLIALGLVEVGD